MNLGPWPNYVGFTTDAGAFDREMRRLKVKNPDAAIAKSRSNATTHFLRSGGKSCAIIVMQPMGRRCSKEQYAALLAHEATHVVQEMRDDLGDLGREAEAYLVQLIVQEGLQIAWKTGRSVRFAP